MGNLYFNNNYVNNYTIKICTSFKMLYFKEYDDEQKNNNLLLGTTNDENIIF